MSGKNNIFSRQLISLGSLELNIPVGLIQTNAMCVHSSISKMFPFVVLLSKSDFAAAISLWNECIQDLITKIFVGIRGDSL